MIILIPIIYFYGFDASTGITLRAEARMSKNK